ncbi:MAG TPA: DoxX family protein [Xanthobacteraceae bacterium]|nr:DoxX family protein [Xanthobacteraceae bacterium]
MDETIRLTGRSWFHPHIVTDGLVAYTNFANVFRVGTLVGCTELVGGILLVLGLFTRFAAAAVLIFMIVAVKFTSAKGFFWSAGGYEYPLLIGLCALFFLIRGGGQCSLDRMIGREI